MLENVRAVQMGPGYIRSESYSRKTKIQGETASTLYTVRIQQHAVKKKKISVLGCKESHYLWKYQ